MLKDLVFIRLERGMSQKVLAKKSGVARTAIQNIEAGRAIPRADTIWHLADALEMPHEQLYFILCKGEDFTKRSKLWA